MPSCAPRRSPTESQQSARRDDGVPSACDSGTHPPPRQRQHPHSYLASPRAVSHSGNITMDDIIRIGRIMRPRSLAKKFEGTVLEMLGTAQSVGCTVDGQDPHDVIDEIHNGDIEIADE